MVKTEIRLWYFCGQTRNCRSENRGNFHFGGDEEDRTLDLTDANRTLSQLSYAPNSSAISVQLRSRNLLYHRIFHMSIQNLHNLINHIIFPDNPPQSRQFERDRIKNDESLK